MTQLSNKQKKTYFQGAGMLKILKRHKYMYRNLLTSWACQNNEQPEPFYLKRGKNLAYLVGSKRWTILESREKVQSELFFLQPSLQQCTRLNKYSHGDTRQILCLALFTTFTIRRQLRRRKEWNTAGTVRTIYSRLVRRVLRLQIFIVNYCSLRKGSWSVHWHMKVWNLYVKGNLAASVTNVLFISSRVVLTLAVSVVSGSSVFTD